MERFAPEFIVDGLLQPPRLRLLHPEAAYERGILLHSVDLHCSSASGRGHADLHQAVRDLDQLHRREAGPLTCRLLQVPACVPMTDLAFPACSHFSLPISPKCWASTPSPALSGSMSHRPVS